METKMLESMFVVAILLEVVFPIVLAFWAVRKLGSSWFIVAMGAVAFVLSQVIHIPLLLVLQPLLQTAGFTGLPPMVNLIFTGLFYGLLAGICEEPMRWLAYKVIKEKGQRPNSSVVLGIGHGGVESVVLVGVSVAATFFTMLSIRSSGVAIPGISLEMMQQYFAMDWSLPLAGAVERLSTIAIHISLSVLVWKSVRHRSWKWFLAAILLHTAYNAIAVIMSLSVVGVWIIEAAFIVFAGLSIFWTIRILKSEVPLQIEEPVVEAAEA
jgi:uncharacterized membrane protein YhfC